MVSLRDNRLMHLTRHAVTMQSLRLHAAAACIAIIPAVKVAFEKEVAP